MHNSFIVDFVFFFYKKRLFPIIESMEKKELLTGIKACIFDLDGTLVDSLSLWNDIDIEFFHARHMEVPKDYSKKISHMNFLEMARFTKEEYGIQESAEEIALLWTNMSEDAYKNRIQAKDGAKDLLKHLSSKGLKLALATTNKASLYVPCLQRNKLDIYFSLAKNVNDFNTSKKEPKIYQMIADEFHVLPKETLVFEDILMAIDTAKNAGFRTVGVYDKANREDEERIKKDADYYVSSFQELTQI